MAEGKPNRRWSRFSLRALLLVVAIAALFSWSYWIGWPWWINFRQQAVFRSFASQLKSGATPAEASEQFPLSDVAGNLYVTDRGVLSEYVWSNAVYCIYFRFNDDEGGINAGCTAIEVYRLPPVPAQYQRRISSWDLDWHWGGEIQPLQGAVATNAYLGDFMEFISGDRKNNPGFEYELIYSTPPTKPAR